MIFNLPPSVNKEVLEHFLSFCETKKYPAKTLIIQPGDAGGRLYFILNGSVSVCMEDDNGGHELILAYLNKNDFIGEIGLFKSTKTRKVSVKTRCECHFAEMSYERLRQVLKNELADYESELIYILCEQLSARLLNTNRNIGGLAFMDVKGRIARVLLDLCEMPEAITHPDGVQLSISRQELGRMVSCSKEMAGRVLKELENNKLITARGKTIVVFGAIK